MSSDSHLRLASCSASASTSSFSLVSARKLPAPSASSWLSCCETEYVLLDSVAKTFSHSLESTSPSFLSASSLASISSLLRLAASAFCRALTAAFISSCIIAACRSQVPFLLLALSTRARKTMVMSARKESVSLRWRQCRSDLRNLKRAMSSLSSFSAFSFWSSTLWCSSCTDSSSVSMEASSASASALLVMALLSSVSAVSRRRTSLIEMASESVTHIRLVRTACIHSSISFSESAARTTLSPLACEITNVNGRAAGCPRSSRVRTLHSSRSTTPEGLSLKPVKSFGELKYMRTLSRNTNHLLFHLEPFSCPPPSLER
mmetsp:Transcript_21584/g.46481  ORF Transcript_21584/g.46481 Transcript_21584/m.46481 type:complete len:319 (-) Transcript_21584:192-1148(-)